MVCWSEIACLSCSDGCSTNIQVQLSYLNVKYFSGNTKSLFSGIFLQMTLSPTTPFLQIYIHSIPVLPFYIKLRVRCSKNLSLAYMSSRNSTYFAFCLKSKHSIKFHHLVKAPPMFILFTPLTIYPYFGH